MSIGERWDDLIPEAGELVADLVGRYTDKHRRAYRDRYLGTALDAADDLIQLATDPVAVRLAVWFHRAAHSDGARRVDDAEASARLAADLLPQYGVSATRVAEVERLIRLTGSPDNAPVAEDDPNGAVVCDAAMAVTASAPAAYQTHATEVRRAIGDQAGDADLRRRAGDRERYAEERHREIEQLLRTGIFRTPLVRDRKEAAARANLKHERDLLDEVIPARWRGWDIAALRALAVFGTLAATFLTVVGSWSPWSEPASDGVPGGVAVLLGLAGLVLTAVLYQLGRKFDRRARIAAGGIAAAGLVALVVCLLRMPEVNPANGIGLRVPLFLAAAVLLVLSAGAVVAAGLLRARTRRHVPERNRGQVLAWLGTAAVVVLLMVYAVEPLARSYLLSRNEHLAGSGTTGQPAPASTLDGAVLWSTDRSTGHFGDAVATRHGIAVPDRSGGVLMLDGQTGEQRWNYQRSDVRGGQPNLFALDGGAALLVRWEDAGDIVLDTATGRRIATWPSGSNNKHRSLQSIDPLVTGQTVSKGSDMLRGADLDGHTRWTYKPGNCLTISAEATDAAVVALLDAGGCRDEPDRVVGLDLRTGKKLWSQDRPDLAFGPVAAGDLVMLVEGQKGGQTLRDLQAIDPRSGNEVWRTPAPSGDCVRPVPAGDLLVLACETGNLTRFVAVEAASGRTAWQHQTAEVEGNRYAVSATGRVVIRTNGTGTGTGCKVISVDRAGVHTVDVRAPEITADNYCRSIVYTLGDLVMVETDEGAVALR